MQPYKYKVTLEYRQEPDLDLMRDIGITGVMAPLEKLTPERIEALKNQSLRLGVIVTAFEATVCPLSREARQRLEAKVQEAQTLRPDAVWLDRLHFDGNWQRADHILMPDAHAPCESCQGKNRVKQLTEAVRTIDQQLDGDTPLGYFAIPFMNAMARKYTPTLGQDVHALREHVDVIAPMLFHRQMGMPMKFVHEYTNELIAATRSHAQVMPLLQVAHTPDGPKNKLSEIELYETQLAAQHPEAIGIAWHSWDQAADKGRVRIIANSIASAPKNSLATEKK